MTSTRTIALSSLIAVAVVIGVAFPEYAPIATFIGMMGGAAFSAGYLAFVLLKKLRTPSLRHDVLSD